MSNDLLTESLLEVAADAINETAAEKAMRAALETRIADVESTLAALKTQLAAMPAKQGSMKLTAGKGRQSVEVTVTGRDEFERITTATVSVKGVTLQ